jgi:hypothetical protein
VRKTTAKKPKTLLNAGYLKLARPRKLRLFEMDDKRIIRESKRTGQSCVELIRQAVSFGLCELLAPRE